VKLPKKTDLPFFAYGAFRPGQLAFHRLKPFVGKIEKATVSGELRIRDGLPILDRNGKKGVEGFVLFFNSSVSEEAYRSIADLEPDAQYQWGEANAGNYLTNILFGRSPKKGSVSADDHDWDGQSDPLFTVALEVVRETLKSNRAFDPNLKPMFHLQMAYLLLWSAIERYVSLRYHLGGKVTDKVKRLGEETAFAEAMQSVTPNPREVCRADKPEEILRLDAANPNRSLDYYYQIRSNIAHRGKAVRHDHDRMLEALEQLSAIFDFVVKRAFDEAKLTA